MTPDDSIFVDYMEKVEKDINGRMVPTIERVYMEATPYTVGKVINGIRARNLSALVIIKADKDVKFGTMQRVMDTMVEENLSRFQIITELEAEAI